MLGSILVNSSDFFNAEVAMISKIIAKNKNRKFFMVYFLTKVNFKAERVISEYLFWKKHLLIYNHCQFVQSQNGLVRDLFVFSD